MELLLLLAGLIAFDILAMRWGHDSREAYCSDEARFAALGYQWNRGAHASQ